MPARRPTSRGSCSGGEPGFDWPDFAALGVTSHPSFGVGPIYRGRFASLSLVVLADQRSDDDTFTARALAGEAGQRFQGVLRAAGLTKRYLIIRTLPVDTLDLTAAKRLTLVDHPKVQALHRELLSRVRRERGITALLAMGPGARRLAPNVAPAGLDVIELAAHDEPGFQASWQAALTQLAGRAYTKDLAEPDLRRPDRPEPAAAHGPAVRHAALGRHLGRPSRAPDGHRHSASRRRTTSSCSCRPGSPASRRRRLAGGAGRGRPAHLTMPVDPLPRYGLRGRVVTMNAARDVIADGIVWVADGSITDVTPASQTPPAHAASPVIATAGTIYPGMIELHNHLAYNAIPLFRIPRLYTKREEWQGTRGYRRYVSGPAGVIASVPDLIRATIRYVECKSLISGTTTSQGLTLRAAPIKHLYKGIVRNAEQPDAAGLDPARPKIGDVTPDGRESFRKSLSGKGARIVHLAEGLPTSKAHDHFLDLQVPERHVGDRAEVRRHPLDGAHARGPRRHRTRTAGRSSGRRSATSSSTAGRPTCAAAIDLGVKVALGSDWAPTASKNLLNELKVARIHSDDQQLGLTDLELVQMVTVTPAEILGWQGSLGSIEPGKLADSPSWPARPASPTAISSTPPRRDIRLVVIGGVARYGTPRCWPS